MPPHGHSKSGPLKRESVSSDGVLEYIQAQTCDPLVRRYLWFFYVNDARRRIAAAAAYFVRALNGPRETASADLFQHQVEDLTQHAWKMLLAQRSDFLRQEEFVKAFIRKMQNYCRWRRRSLAGDVPMVDLEHADGQPAAGIVVPFPPADRVLAARQEVILLREAVAREAPDLDPLFALFEAGVMGAGEQAAKLDTPVKQIYEMRRRLKRLAGRVIDLEG